MFLKIFRKSVPDMSIKKNGKTLILNTPKLLHRQVALFEQT